MIFVTVGTSSFPFDRLVRAADELADLDDIVVQRGASRIDPSRARTVDFLSFDELVGYVRAARVVITHAGVGSIMVALGNGKRPYVVPRRREFGEAVDDHQFQLARELGRTGRVTVVEDLQNVREVLASTVLTDPDPWDASASPLVEEIAAYAASVLRPD